MNTLKPPPEHQETDSRFTSDYGTPPPDAGTGLKHKLLTWFEDRSLFTFIAVSATSGALALLLLFAIGSWVISLFSDDNEGDTALGSVSVTATTTTATAASTTTTTTAMTTTTTTLATTTTTKTVTLPAQQTECIYHGDDYVPESFSCFVNTKTMTLLPPGKHHVCRTTTMNSIASLGNGYDHVTRCYFGLLLLSSECLDYLSTMPWYEWVNQDGLFIEHDGLTCWIQQLSTACSESYTAMKAKNKRAVSLNAIYFRAAAVTSNGEPFCSVARTETANHTRADTGDGLPAAVTFSPPIMRTLDNASAMDGGKDSACRTLPPIEMAPVLAQYCLNMAMLEDSQCLDYLDGIPTHYWSPHDHYWLLPLGDYRWVPSPEDNKKHRNDGYSCLAKELHKACDKRYNEVTTEYDTWMWLLALMVLEGRSPSNSMCELMSSHIASQESGGRPSSSDVPSQTTEVTE